MIVTLVSRPLCISVYGDKLQEMQALGSAMPGLGQIIGGDALDCATLNAEAVIAAVSVNAAILGFIVWAASGGLANVESNPKISIGSVALPDCFVKDEELNWLAGDDLGAGRSQLIGFMGTFPILSNVDGMFLKAKVTTPATGTQVRFDVTIYTIGVLLP